MYRFYVSADQLAEKEVFISGEMSTTSKMYYALRWETGS